MSMTHWTIIPRSGDVVLLSFFKSQFFSSPTTQKITKKKSKQPVHNKSNVCSRFEKWLKFFPTSYHARSCSTMQTSALGQFSTFTFRVALSYKEQLQEFEHCLQMLPNTHACCHVPLCLPFKFFFSTFKMNDCSNFKISSRCFSVK